MQGSLCPSHFGAAGLVKSLDHESLLSMGSCTMSWLLEVPVLKPDGDVSAGDMNLLAVSARSDGVLHVDTNELVLGR